jgi:hypothetical protein
MIFKAAMQNLPSGCSGHFFIGDKTHTAGAFEAG